VRRRRLIGKLAGRNAGMTKNPGRLFECLFMSSTLRTPALQRFDVRPGRLAGLQANDPIKGLFQQRNPTILTDG
jgi:hypothetical protein